MVALFPSGPAPAYGCPARLRGWAAMPDLLGAAAGGDVPTADDLLAALDPEQREVATSLRGPVCVLAGAGTGKTRAITYRIAYGVRAGVIGASHVLAVTFTARA